MAQLPQAEEHPLHGGVDAETFDKLEKLVASPAFLKTLEMTASCVLQPATAGPQASTSHSEEAPGVANGGASSSTMSADATAGWCYTDPADEEFIMVETEDAVESIAYYIAQCLAKCPDAQALSPKQLQDALKSALQGLKQSRFKQLCSMGRYVYRWSALTYSALQMYQNPWLIQAVVTALWTLSRVGVVGIRTLVA